MSSKPKSERIVFFLGATGYLGSQFLVLLGRSILGSQTHVVALVRNVDSNKEKRLKAIYPNLSIVEGDLDSDDIIKEEAGKAQCVINCASSDNERCVKSILAGLDSRIGHGISPLYIHVSGLTILNDNSRGEKVEEHKIPVYNDIHFSHEQLLSGAPHLNCDALIVAAGTRKIRPLRTIIAYPGWIYGVGEGYRKGTAALRIFIDICKPLKRIGTWGPGHNAISNIHVIDAAKALLQIFEAALEGKADVGSEGHYFLASEEQCVPFGEIMNTVGDVLYRKKLFTYSGSSPVPREVTDMYGEFGWILMGGNHRVSARRMRKLGWYPEETKKVSLLASLPAELEVVLEQDLICY